MQKNLGKTDRIIRALAGIVLGVLVATGTISGTAAIIAGIIAVALVGTSALAFCPLYFPLKLTTAGKSQNTK